MEIDLKNKYGGLYREVLELLFEADPIGINFEFNTDEYRSEVGTILPRLHKAKSESDVRMIVYEEFVHWFDAECAGPIEAYTDISARIWELWRDYNLSPPASSRQTSEGGSGGEDVSF